MNTEVLVVGGGTAGSAAAYQIGRRGIKTVLVAGERHIGYSKCGLPYLVGGIVKTPEDLYEIPPETLRAVGVKLRYPVWVNHISLNEKTAILSDESQIKFEKLVLATGAKPVIPPIPGLDLQGVIYLRTMEDALRILELLRGVRHVALIGANLTGVELSEAFLSRGLNVYLIDIMDRPLWRILDPDMSKLLLRRMKKEKRLKLFLSCEVERIRGVDKVESVVIRGYGEVKAELVVLGTGARPNSELAKSMGLKIGVTGGVVVDEYLRADKDVYAIGDCIEVRDIVTNRPTLAQLSSAAERQAWVVAANISGEKFAYGGELPVAMTRFFDVYVGVAGYTHQQAVKAGLNPVSKSVVSRTSSPFMPGANRIHLKLTVNANGRLIGGQVVGYDAQAVAQRVNMIAMAIQLGCTVDDLRRFRHGYAPPLSDVVDPFVKAGWMMASEL